VTGQRGRDYGLDAIGNARSRVSAATGASAHGLPRGRHSFTRRPARTRRPAT